MPTPIWTPTETRAEASVLTDFLRWMGREKGVDLGWVLGRSSLVWRERLAYQDEPMSCVAQAGDADAPELGSA